ncbi:serine/threonine-protein kinase [Nonomuraea glycinis]|uniref:serine/threonine-protein kinase n=1 Tax=Nonomuraea glycinis TaxID=2047744 RepID=UPI0033AF9127
MPDLRAADPRRLGTYRLSARLGQGGQGVVYLGHTGNGAKVAIKLLHAGLSDDQAVRRRFRAEVEAVRRVAPFCTAQLLDADLEGDRPYLVSEYVDGISLTEHVIAQGPRIGGSLHRLAIGTATALGAIHRAAVVHRDFKPGNVLLSLDGPRVIDFGISRPMDSTATTGRFPIGTPAYLAPERIKGEPAGAPADLYAWALTVAYTANGRHAYTAETHQEVLARILYGKPDLGMLTGRLRELVDACLAVEPGDRPDAEEVLRRLLSHDLTGRDVLSTGALAALDTALDSGAPDTVDWRVPGSGGTRTTGARSALAALVDPDAHASSEQAAPRAAVTVTRPQPRVLPEPGPRLPVARTARGRPGSWRLAATAVTVAVLVIAAVALWTLSGGPGANGVWTGSAEHPSADRVFPVEIRLDGGPTSSMRWGADLRCSGTLSPAGEALVYELGEVEGEECYPGTLRMLPTAEANQMAISVIRRGEQEVTYSGKVSRVS